MEEKTNGQTPNPSDLVDSLKARFDYQWVAADDRKPWEFRLRFKLLERESSQFRIHMAIVANRNGDLQDYQHAAYLELINKEDKLSLCWSSVVNHTLEKATSAFRSIYPLELFISDILQTLEAYQVEVLIPEINLQEIKVREIRTQTLKTISIN